MKTQVFVLAFITAGLFFTFSSTRAERAPRKAKQLDASASHVVSGAVHHQYVRKERKGMYEHRHIVAELTVNKVNKGDDIQVGDRIFVRYWSKAWLGPADQPEPGSYGFHPSPKPGDSTLVYLKGDRKKGYEVLHPNGFFNVTKPQK